MTENYVPRFTPGPWTVEKFQDNLGINAGEGRVAWVSFDDEQGQADARLIAAAPDLLSALTDLLAAPESDAAVHFEGQGLGPVEYRAHEAILKAVGS